MGLEPTRVMVVYNDGRKMITNNQKLFGNPELLLATFRFQLQDGTWSEEEFWFKHMYKGAAIYNEKKEK
jgi:hypothetical protein